MAEFLYLDTEKLNDSVLYEKYLSKLSDYRRAKLERYRLKQAKLLCLGAGILIDKGLKAYGLKEKDMEYAVNKHGKPCFRNRPDIHFNVSHSGTKVICVFSEEEAGCDIESKQVCNRELADRFFHPDEAKIVHELPRGSAVFYRYWTLKESYIKALGRGLSLPLNSFRINLGEKITVDCEEEDTDFSFFEYADIPKYCVSLCIKETKKPKLKGIIL